MNFNVTKFEADLRQKSLQQKSDWEVPDLKLQPFKRRDESNRIWRHGTKNGAENAPLAVAIHRQWKLLEASSSIGKYEW